MNRTYITALESNNQWLVTALDVLRISNTDLRAEIVGSHTVINALRAENEALRAENAAWRTQSDDSFDAEDQQYALVVRQLQQSDDHGLAHDGRSAVKVT